MLSREREAELFRATVGGMGLTGHILEVELRMERVPSPWIVAESGAGAGRRALRRRARRPRRRTGRSPSAGSTVSPPRRRRGLGRGVLHRGPLGRARRRRPPGRRPSAATLAVPFVLPGWVLNRFTVRAFNTLYYTRTPWPAAAGGRGRVHPESFFYPLDAIRHWNRLYGPRGFTQYQCVLPDDADGGPAAAARRFLDLLTGATRRAAAPPSCA